MGKRKLINIYPSGIELLKEDTMTHKELMIKQEKQLKQGKALLVKGREVLSEGAKLLRKRQIT